jgi:hypothetical protein
MRRKQKGGGKISKRKTHVSLREMFLDFTRDVSISTLKSFLLQREKA